VESIEANRQRVLQSTNIQLRQLLHPNVIHHGNDAAIACMCLARNVMDLPPLETLIVSYSFMAHFLSHATPDSQMKHVYLKLLKNAVLYLKKDMEAVCVLPDSIVTTSVTQGELLATEFFEQPVVTNRHISMESLHRARNAIAEEANTLFGHARVYADAVSKTHIIQSFGVNM